ncbi:HAMP domain-containing sensor histidine kinase [Telmatospirillum sp.]|uniref:sensor histidine kinase n=1 Tax=Telmatospirillum sp. TaxID=2079197 RepID=UPI002850D728|nr:HAMP domain-containing sensor histidine kinase [Telmatospirillum sp.]MDR3441332.1 HAMP domain-containing sensor histidine kinase [Telmatospirillum sp.]
MIGFSRKWLLRPGIGRRIALTMALSLVAVQAQAFIQIWLFSNPKVQLTGTRWLAQTASDAMHDAMSLPPEARRAWLNERQQSLPIHLDWSPTQPWPESAQDDGPISARLIATLHEILGRDAAHINVTTVPRFPLFPIDPLKVEIEPSTVVDQLGTSSVDADQPDILIPFNMRIAIQATDGSWVSADPANMDSVLTAALPLTALLGGGAIIVLMSTLMARHIVAPLDRLIVAAEAIGTSRELVTVGVEGLGEFAAVARAFEDMQQRLTRFVGDRTQMLAAISHDLRTSLTRLKLAADGDLGAESQASILSEIDDMETMVEATLSFAAGEALVVPSRLIDVAALLISLVDDAADLGKRCDYKGPDHCETIGHPISLKRAFSNIIDNATKYGTCAHVTLESGSSTLRVAITDEGPGIPPEQMEEAFKPFRRLDPSRSGEMRGSGLGLTIAKDAVHSHGGTIWMENKSDRGLTVMVELPRR